MLQDVRGADDCFVFLATPLASGRYGLTIYPQLPESTSEVEVSKGRLRVFLLRHSREIAVERISGTDDLFVSAMTEGEMRELMGDAVGLRRCSSRPQTR